MNSIERVQAALRFQCPDRVPVWKAGLGDVLPLPMLPAKSWQPGHAPHERGLFPFVGDDTVVRWRLWRWRRPEWARFSAFRDYLRLPREEVDEWGAIWMREGRNRTMGHPGRPVLTSWDDFDLYLRRYQPHVEDRSRYAVALAYNRVVGPRRYRVANLWFQGPFTAAMGIRGFNNFMTDHHLHPEELRRLLDHITDKFVRAMRAWVAFGARPHAFAIYDDLADQNRSFLNPTMFREFYRPVFKTMIDEAHALGCDFIFHSCGKIDALIPVLLEWGIDALELDSPRMTGFPALAPFRGRVMIWGCVDIQTIYTRATPEAVEREVRDMVRNLGTESGGFGAYIYPQPYHIQAPPENVKAFMRGIEKYGDYSRLEPGFWEDRS